MRDSADVLRRGANSERPCGGLFEPLRLGPHYQLKIAEADGLAYAATLGATSLEALRRLPASGFTGPGAASISHPVVDTYVLPLAPSDAYAQGRRSDVPLLVGSNQEEARSLTMVGDVTAATGDPNGPGLPRWPRFEDPARGPMMDLGTSISPGPVADLTGLKAFDAAYDQIRGALLPTRSGTPKIDP
jgi:hypothetical protein